MLRSWDLRRTNNVLLALIILINLYVIVAPFYPAVVFWLEKHNGTSQKLEQQINPANGQNSNIPSKNTLVVPSMALNTNIIEGTVAHEYSVLNEGVWRWPLGSTPDKGGNTILIGHRFTYTQPRGIFYELPQVKTGDLIGVFWLKKEYIYKVFKVSTVSPSDVGILDQTKQAELTLYTCTPVWNPVHRFLVVAKLVNGGKA